MIKSLLLKYKEILISNAFYVETSAFLRTKKVDKLFEFIMKDDGLRLIVRKKP